MSTSTDTHLRATALWDADATLGCDVAQGYGIAVPMSFPDLRGWLSSWQDVAVGPPRPAGAPVTI